MRVIGMFVLITSLTTPAFAQELPRRLIISKDAIAAGLEKNAPPPPQPRGDSLANGAIIGAAIGGIAMGASGGWICHMLREPSDPPCWKSVWPVAAIAAGIGAGIGAGIDALKARTDYRPPARLRDARSDWK